MAAQLSPDRLSNGGGRAEAHSYAKRFDLREAGGYGMGAVAISWNPDQGALQERRGGRVDLPSQMAAWRAPTVPYASRDRAVMGN